MPPIAFHAADEEMVRHILRETGVATRPAGPQLTSYLGAWVEALMRWIGGLLEGSPGLPGRLLNVAVIVALVTVALGLALVAVTVLRHFWNRGSSRSSAPLPEEAEAPASASARDRQAWRVEIEARLSRGDVAGALEALWWWLASALPLDSGADASWTTRELLVKARRPELLGLGAALDTLMYGPLAPSAQNVAACLARFEERLA